MFYFMLPLLSVFAVSKKSSSVLLLAMFGIMRLFISLELELTDGLRLIFLVWLSAQRVPTLTGFTKSYLLTFENRFSRCFLYHLC